MNMNDDEILIPDMHDDNLIEQPKPQVTMHNKRGRQPREDSDEDPFRLPQPDPLLEQLQVHHRGRRYEELKFKPKTTRKYTHE